MSVTTEPKPSSDESKEEKKEEKELTWDEAKRVDTPLEIVRTPGNKRYRIKYHDISGETYEDLAIKARSNATETRSYSKLISEYMRLAVIFEIAGKPYNDKTFVTMDREMSPWMKEDISQFIQDYISGEL